MIIYCVLFGILGLCIGSFLNVVIYRIPVGLSIAKPASHCTACNAPLKWRDNIPLLSYIFLGGKCRYCKVAISPRYFIVELLNALAYVAITLIYHNSHIVVQIAYMVTSSCLICVGAIDMDTKMIYHRFTVVIACMGVLFTVFNVLDGAFHSNILGALVGGGILGLFYLGSLLVFKREGLGLGDCILMTAVGFALGLRRTIFALLVGSVVAAVWLVILNCRDHKKASIDNGNKDDNASDRFKEYPFAPFLCGASLLAILCGDYVINLYLSLFIV